MSIRGRRSRRFRFVATVAPRRRRRPLPGPSRPDPPRCCVVLQRVTVRRSRSSGFAAPPAPLRLSAWTLACSAEPPPGRLPFRLDTAHGLSLTLEDLVRVPVRTSRSAHGGQPFVTSVLPWGSSPLRRSQSGESLSRSSVFPRPLPPALAASGWPVVAPRLTPRRFRCPSSRASTPAKIRLRRFSRP
jgi:hypothetical protein